MQSYRCEYFMTLKDVCTVYAVFMFDKTKKWLDSIENVQFVYKEFLQIAGFGRWMYDGHRIFPAIMLFRWSSNSPVKADFVHLKRDRLLQDY